MGLMKEFLNRLIALRKSGDKMHEMTLPKTCKQNVTPEWIDTLQETKSLFLVVVIQADTLMEHRTLHLKTLVLLWGSVKVVKGNHTPFPLLVE